MKEVMIFTDGACSGNPGPGGWGTILRFGEHEKELSGGERETTNNRMELTAVIKGWAKGWRKKGWKRSGGEPALNPDLWERLLDLLEVHEAEFRWIKGHAGHPENERCDAMAVAEWQRFK